jgi:1,4-dihydroxy-2-naphthoate octaprenyltransferase
MTITSALIGGLLAFSHPDFNGWLLGLAAIGVVLAHASNNMMNDLFDTREGLDRKTYPRALYAPHPVLAGLITRKGLITAIIAVNFLDMVIMVVLYLARGWPIVAFALAGFAISFFYTAPPLRLKAWGAGEPSVGIVWGPLMVGGTYYAAVGSIPAAIWWASIPYALLVISVLVGKHIDKAPWDEPEGIRTLPVLLGEKVARGLNSSLIIGFYLTTGALVAASVLPVWTLAVVGATPLTLKTLETFSKPKPSEPPDDNPVWPLWFAPWAFIHARRSGALFVLGLVVNLFVPLSF